MGQSPPCTVVVGAALVAPTLQKEPAVQRPVGVAKPVVAQYDPAGHFRQNCLPVSG